MKRIITSMDRHGRMLIPASIREKCNLHSGEKIIIEVNDNDIKIVNADHIIDEMHTIFTKNQTNKSKSIVDDFIDTKRREFLIEEKRSNKNV